jgi:hypothetical protein
MATAQHDRQSSEDEHLSAPSSDTDPLMSNTDQHLRDQARRGDNPALYVALVRTPSTFHSTTNPHRPHRPLGIRTGERIPHCWHATSEHDPTHIQVLLISTWTIVLSNNPKALSWFAFHPTLNSLAVLCFTFGTFSPSTTQSKFTEYMHRRSHSSTDVPTEDKGRWTSASSDRDANRTDIHSPGHHGNVDVQGLARRSSLHILARCTRVLHHSWHDVTDKCLFPRPLA